MPAKGSHPVLADSTPVYVGGVTGGAQTDDAGGKTTTAAWWTDKAVEAGHFRFALAFSPKGSNFPDFEQVSNAREAAAAVKDGARRLEWTPPGSPADMPDLDDAHAEAMSFADGLRGDVIAVHDDAQLYPGADSLAWAVSMAANPGGADDVVKSLVVAQDPWDLPRQSIRSNLTVMVWVGPVTDNAERYFQVMETPDVAEKVRERHARPYMWSVIDADGSVTSFEPVPDRYA